MERLIKSLQWIDNNILKILVIGFIFIIPLYPKIPLFGVNYTYIAIRLEDLYLAIITGVFFIQLLRKKVSISKKFALLFGLFWVTVFISYSVGFYIQKTIPYEFKTIGLLHAIRRVEYMIVFFIAAAAVKTRKDFKLYLNLVFFVLGLVCIYGLGQKFLGWPAVQTMNPEFAKGYFLILDSWARISSTFAGHYDLSAYLVFLLPILIGAYESYRRKTYMVLFLLALSTLIFSASRISYGAYIISIIVYLIYIRKFKMLIFVLIATAILTPLSSNLTDRISRTFQKTKLFVDPDTGQVIIPHDNKPDVLPPGSFGAAGTDNIVKEKVEVNEKEIAEAKSQIRSKIIKDAEAKGQRLTPEQIEALVNQAFGNQIPITKYLIDISTSNRIQVSWPRSIYAFRENILLGSGPSSLGEATDGDYFRWLGETGLLGFTLFLGIIFSVIGFIWFRVRSLSKQSAYIYHGYIFGTFGLLLNATFIDVFEASKLAYTFWLVSGLFIASIYLLTKNKIKTEHLKI